MEICIISHATFESVLTFNIVKFATDVHWKLTCINFYKGSVDWNFYLCFFLEYYGYSGLLDLVYFYKFKLIIQDKYTYWKNKGKRTWGTVGKIMEQNPENGHTTKRIKYCTV